LKEPRKRNHRLDASEVGRLDRTRDSESPAMLCRTTASIAEAEATPPAHNAQASRSSAKLEAVANEAVDLSIENDWVLADASQEAHVRSTTCRLVAGIPHTSTSGSS